MKKVLIAICLFMLVLSQGVFAHSPSRIDLDYNPQTSILSVVVFHNVTDPENHYVAKVTVAINGKSLIEDVRTVQDDKDKQTIKYRLPELKKGDSVTVEASCSIQGTHSALLELE
ncbi:MAG: hypothetical protein GF409_01015 [Candidatus Omnitrophica bacterium]|nr:hypothetical protein [Candidatus Omnitrophota bacterium]